MEILKDYRNIVDETALDGIREKADSLYGKHILFINSTYQGGGVAEILDSAVILLNELGLEVGWRILHGTPDFFTVTKKFHNALQGESINLSKQKEDVYYYTNMRFSIFTHIDHDLVLIHDPQPLALIDFYEKKQPWIFRCHIDLSSPNPEVWNYLRQFVLKYDHMVVSLERYKQDIPIPQSVIYPAIDPLSSKNKEISDSDVDKYMKKYDIDRDRPIITQISRFDQWKDPLGAIDVYRLVKQEIPNVQLLLVGSMTEDDPEGWSYFENTARYACNDKDIHLLADFKGVGNLEVNAFQRASQVALQMSIREGFGLAVSEAMWKQVPVVGRNAAGISLQIIDGVNGFLIKTVKEAAEKTIYLLKHQDAAKQMGIQGKEFVRNHLITKNLNDYLTLFSQLLQ